MNQRAVLIAFSMLLLAVLACNRTAATATPVAGTAGPPAVTDVGLPTIDTDATEVPPPPSQTPSLAGVTPSVASSTPTETAPGCDYDTEFVADVTIPDDTELEPGENFTKTWRIRNDGNCVWEPGTTWSFETGDKMGGPDSVSVAETEPDDTTDIAVHLTAPDESGAYIGYWRMRRPNGDSFGMRSFVRVVVTEGEGTATPTTSPTPTATLVPGVGPSIVYFRGNVDEADPGDTITLEWETEDATAATLYHLMPTGQLGSFWEVEVSGVFEYEIDAGERNHTDFLLVINDDEGGSDQASLSITLRCPDTWFFTPAPDECPGAPALVSAAAEQAFENGVMVWIQSQDLIYVLFDDGQSPHWRAYADEWDEGEPVDDPALTPPAGRYQPQRGFGLVWRERPGVRERLGWATAVESSYSTHVQYTSRPRYNDTFIGARDGKVWKLLPESSGWEKIP